MRLIALLMTAVIIAGASIAILILYQDNDQYYVTIVGGNGIALNVTLTDMRTMTEVSRNSSYQNTYGNIRGVGLYTGVKISDLIDLVGGMQEDDTVRVIARDDYSQVFKYEKVYPNQTYWDIQGDMVLAYEYNEIRVPDYEDGFRLVFLPEDGYYSNEDANATTDPDPAAAGPQWVSNVARIEVLPYLFSTTVNLVESELRTLPATTGAGGYLKKDGFTIFGPFNYTGVKVTYLLEQISDLPENYIVISQSGDGYTYTYTKEQVYGELSGYTPTGDPIEKINSTMLVAYEQDAVPITEEDGGSLRIVYINEDGNLTDGGPWSKDVISLTIIEIAPQLTASCSDESSLSLLIANKIAVIVLTKLE